VWFPDSAYKTAQAIRDFNRAENLPLIIFANWRGFSGGTRDMFAEILKYGSMIVDALVEYAHPVTIYIPPNGELRGGAWVVLDPSINAEQMEMYADEASRGGILEPPAAATLVWKEQQLRELMHRSDPVLRSLDAKLGEDANVAAEITAREKFLRPLYTQVAVEFCDLHDKPGRMEKVGAIRQTLSWRTSREYLHWRIRRRVLESALKAKVRRGAKGVRAEQIANFLASLQAEVGTEDDKAVAEWLEANRELIDSRIAEMHEKLSMDDLCSTFSSISTGRQTGLLREVFSALSSAEQSELLRDFEGLGRVEEVTAVASAGDADAATRAFSPLMTDNDD
jgi:acetyl-CoA carboxylase/biotin carboxylase 1